MAPRDHGDHAGKAPGEKLFVDFAGDTVPVFDGLTGGARRQDLRPVIGKRRLQHPSSVQEPLPTGSAPMWMRLPPGGVPKAVVSTI